MTEGAKEVEERAKRLVGEWAGGPIHEALDGTAPLGTNGALVYMIAALCVEYAREQVEGWRENEDGPLCSCGGEFTTVKRGPKPAGGWGLLCFSHTRESGAWTPLPDQRPADWNVHANCEPLLEERDDLRVQLQTLRGERDHLQELINEKFPQYVTKIQTLTQEKTALEAQIIALKNERRDLEAEMVTMEARERALREALLAQALAHDYAGEPCFCGDDARNPPLTPEHIPSCLQARAALAPRPRHE